MNDPAILFLKPKAISARDKSLLREAGVIVIEIDDPASVKFVRPSAEITASEMLMAALKAINTNNYSSSSQSAFSKALFEAMSARKAVVAAETLET